MAHLKENASAENDPRIYAQVRNFLKGLNSGDGKPIEQLSPADADLIAEHYQSTSSEVRASWERANAALTAD